MEQNEQNTNRPIKSRPDGISIGRLLMKTKEYFFLLCRYWYLIIIFCFCFSFYNLIQMLEIIPTYPCKASFLIKTQTVLKENAVFSKIFAKLSVSEITLRSSLFQKVTMDKRDDLLINHYIDIYQQFYPEQFGLVEIKPNFKFINTDIDSFIVEEKIAYNYVISLILRKNTTFRDGFINLALDEKIGFLDIHFSSPSEDLSIAFLKVHTEVGEKLFFDSAIYPDKEALSVRKNQVDLLREKFRESYYELGRVKDKYTQYKNKLEDELEKEERDIVKRESNILHNYVNRINRLDIATQIFKSDYMAGLENLQSVEMDKISSHPLITLTEFTSSPIGPILPSWKKSLVIDIITSGLMISILIVALKILKDIIRELKIEQEAIKQDKMKK
ncbi:MAG: hypothetical protein AB8H03_01200 [Saprospiraceae bacterium]